jgi:hypothetical protein
MPHSEERGPTLKGGRNGRAVSNTGSLEAILAFSLEEAPCGSTGFFTVSKPLFRNRSIGGFGLGVNQMESPLIHHQGIICCVACVRSSLRRIGPYASVVASWRLASDAFLVIRIVAKPVDSYVEP